MLALIIAGNAVAASASGHGSLIAARFITGRAHGVFFAIASTIATDRVEREKENSAIAAVFIG